MATSPVYIYGKTVNDALDLARAELADMVLPPDGFPSGTEPGRQFNETGGGANLSTGINPDGTLILRTQVILNAAWRKLQKYLANLGYRQLIVDNFILFAVPINNASDPAVQTWISWTGNGLFNGTAYTNFASSPALPSDFLAPLKMEERGSGQNSVFFPMRPAPDGIRTRYNLRTTFNRVWEWRNNALFLPGATQLIDLQLRYSRKLPDFPDPNYYVANTPWYNQILPIPFCENALAWYVVHEALQSGGAELVDAQAAALENAKAHADEVFNDQARADQRTNNRRRPRGYRNSSRGRQFYGV